MANALRLPACSADVATQSHGEQPALREGVDLEYGAHADITRRYGECRSQLRCGSDLDTLCFRENVGMKGVILGT